jgi:divalent metal cation (Fe/Co/Zn/Cd) transporter
MMKADWMAEAATAVGVVGSGFGFSWIDPLAAAFVSADVLKDGVTNLKAAVLDLVDRRPRKTDQSAWERLPDEVRDMLRELPWVNEAEVRMREEGHVFMGEAFIVPRPGTPDLVRKLERASEAAKALDWRMHDLTIMPVESLPGLGSREARRGSG